MNHLRFSGNTDQTMDSDRRSGIDRRKQTGISVRLFMGDGNRTIIRRKEDRDRIFLVDQYSPVLFATIVAILFLCVIDALLTLYLLKHGAYEINPIMVYLLKIGPYVLFILKYALTCVATFCLLCFIHFQICLNVCCHLLLVYVSSCYHSQIQFKHTLVATSYCMALCNDCRLGTLLGLQFHLIHCGWQILLSYSFTG